jgi:hypothetical protein
VDSFIAEFLTHFQNRITLAFLPGMYVINHYVQPLESMSGDLWHSGTLPLSFRTEYNGRRSARFAIRSGPAGESGL